MRRLMFLALCAPLAVLAQAGAAHAQATFPYDHVHLNVPAVRRLLAEPTVAEILACRDPASTSHDR